MMSKQMDKWEKGEYTYNKAEEALMKLKGGEKIGEILSNCTICPVGNATCTNFMELTIVGFHPEKKLKPYTIMICSLGVRDDDDCPLSK